MINENIIVKKMNIFDHIFYEFIMYLKSYNMKFKDQYLYNINYTAHYTYLRNISYFFDCNRKNNYYITYCDLIGEEPKIDFEPLIVEKIQELVSSTISHLTINRVTKENIINGISNEVMNLRTIVFPLVKNKISEFIVLLDKNIIDEYKKQYEEEHIQQLKNSIEIILNKQEDNIHYSENDIATSR